ncbi:uncharacterized protein LOC112350194 isoform X1 [Selaginella moellendorffii]|uniref:uncharacterized protein LOC112350194 isoform X1 n=1 Tax=Selaginella moellendorffii TaxID=88036 RepID=UPI000D1CFEF6|nr:uncharacterized protein LOC112350194 isoform X1 [Selaginella moellendorffii]XP_024541756.1 uncharacterized protein LOC112350194 isoform X1 [Selaginella moellendorffii]|eukprot:XP_024541755.1 uncharacterized protein LOC112350194 isoform X1 [Selaginella moellendorffii]
MAEVSSWVPALHQLPGGGGVQQRSSLQGSKRLVPPLALHNLNAAAAASPGHGSRSATRSGGSWPGTGIGSRSSVVLQPREFLDSILQGSQSDHHTPRPPPRPSPRVTAWKKKAAVFGRMEWDTLSSSHRRTTSHRLPISTQRTSSSGRPDAKRKIGRTMAPSMFAKTDAKNLLSLYQRQANHYVETFKRPPPPSRTVPSSFPGYRLHRRIQGTWAYQPPDTRQKALNEWFVKHMKRPPPPIEKVHVAFGKVTYPFQFSTRKKKPGTEVPEPVIEPPKMTLIPRKSKPLIVFFLRVCSFSLRLSVSTTTTARH